VGDWLIEMQRDQVEMRDYEYSPLVEVQGWSDIHRGKSLFETLLVFENYPLDAALREQGESDGSIKIERIKPAEQTNYPLTISAVPGKEFFFKISYDCKYHDADSIARMLDHFEAILSSLTSGEEQRLSDITMLTPMERRQTLEWSQNRRPFFTDLCVHQQVTRVAERRPDSIAVGDEAHQLTYRELNRRANQLAHHLRQLGVGPEALVGLSLDRSIEMIVAVLGVFKAGAAYLPLDPDYPLERLAYMIDDTRLQALITSEAHLERLPSFYGQVVCVDLWDEEIGQGSEAEPESGVGAGNLAYVIYTSGSTGKPKGVMLQHGGLTNLAQAQVEAFGVSAESRVLQFASLSFDASISEIAMAMWSGARLELSRRERLLEAGGLEELIEQRRLTTLTLPPAMLRALREGAYESVQTIVVAGEASSRELLEKWGEGRTVINAYGPTEDTVCASAQEWKRGDERVTIGRAIANAEMYLVGAAGELAPVGVKGEIYLGGDGVGRGYLNHAELTAERFVPDEYSGRGGRRLYRTGDWGRYVEDGRVEYVGRGDGQVKVRGYRVELGEVEVVLRGARGVSECVVVMREEESGDKRLVAYVVGRGEETGAGEEIREYLKERLPEYMAPSAYVMMEALPLTPNGKIDRNALSTPHQALSASIGNYVPPNDEFSLFLAELWQRVLGVEKVGMNDNFFELGGDSIKALHLINKLQEELGAFVYAATIFDAPTVSGLVSHIREFYPDAFATTRGVPEALISIPSLPRNNVRIEELVAELERMSDEEAQSLLMR
jgi:amino acid adenylation domain-containing protein